jgi:hypothetical protein
MDRLDFTLLSDGSSDAILINPITWLMEQYLHRRGVAINGSWADLRRLPKPPKDLRDRIQVALDLYPCHILFIHRDGEREPLERRIEEIVTASEELGGISVPVVPVRMQETWLLIDEQALRRASGNPNGKVPLAMPDIKQLEDVPNPKQLLHELLSEASELSGRRRQKLNPRKLALRLGELIENFAPLRALPAFQRTERDTVDALHCFGLLPNADE